MPPTNPSLHSKSDASLRAHWTHLYHTVLPEAAKSNDPVQKTWPVVNDQCFLRLVLDNAIGRGRPWEHDGPAKKKLSRADLEAAVDLAERIATGEVDLVELEERSLALRGIKTAGKRKAEMLTPPADGGEEETKLPAKKRRAAETGTISSYFLPSPNGTSGNKNDQPTSLSTETKAKPDSESPKEDADENEDQAQKTQQHDDQTPHLLHLISTSTLTPFRKTALSLLLQIPPGRWSTYQALADHITLASHKTCARAVGSAMRNNPFAPGVPCHRVLAADRTLGGFCGYWGEGGKFANKKHELLFGEGVRFDERGRVRGEVFRGFKA